MRYTNIASLLDLSVPDVDLTLKVFVAYEDIAAGKRAKETCDALAGNLGRDWKIKNQIVSFKMMNVPEWLCAAAVEAALADVIIVACSGNKLPRSAKDWVELWMCRDTRAMSLVALFECPTEDATKIRPAKEYLATAAKLAGMQFFSRLGAATESRMPWSFSRRGLSEEPAL